jgi:hypothetical protein
VFITFGYVIAAWSSVGFYYMKSPINWRIPVSGLYTLLLKWMKTLNFSLQLILQIIWPIGGLLGIPFVPECEVCHRLSSTSNINLAYGSLAAPRWLAFRGKEDQSLDILKKIHAQEDDPHHLIAREEHYQIVQQVIADKAFSYVLVWINCNVHSLTCISSSSWWTMFTKFKRRTAVAALICAANQGSGVQVITSRALVSFALSPDTTF